MQALLSALVAFGFLVAGFAKRQLTELVAALWDNTYTARQATYDLRRLRRKGLMERIPPPTATTSPPWGEQWRCSSPKPNGRVLTPGLAVLDPALPEDISQRSPLATDWRRFNRTLDDYADRQLIAA